MTTATDRMFQAAESAIRDGPLRASIKNDLVWIPARQVVGQRSGSSIQTRAPRALIVYDTW